MGLGLSGLRLGLGQRLWGTVWSPANLFPTGTEEGLFFDFSDISTLYLTSTFQTNVSAYGDPVGGVLDKSQGLVLGSELVGNRVGNGDTIVSGVRIENPTAGTWFSNYATFDVTFEAGKTYWLETSITNISGQPEFRFTNNADVVADFSSSTGFSRTFAYTPSSAGGLRGFCNGYASVNDVIVSVRELPGHHLIQSTAAARPIWTRHPKSGVRNLVDNSDNFTGGNVTVTAVPHTISTADAVTVTLSGASTAGPLVGPGELQFTPSAGTLTLAMSGAGDVQVELGSSATAYQTRVSKYNVTEAGVADCYGLTFDGVDDYMVTAANLDLSGTRRASICVGEMADDVDVFGVPFAHGNVGSVNGSFEVQGNEISNYYRAVLRANGAFFQPNTSTVASGVPVIIASTMDNIGSVVTIRKNGVAGTPVTTTQTAQNFANATSHVGARQPTVGRRLTTIYGVTLTDYILDAEQLAALEEWTAARTPEVTLA